ncbi:MAG: hypothetical protein ACRENP_27275 [Longimicrobiales bacterium]
MKASAKRRVPVPGWLTGRADTGGLPALLTRLAQAVPVTTIDEVWLFPTRRLSGFESTVIVLSLYTDEPDRRRVVTAHFKATRNKRGEATIDTSLEDHAVAPADRLIRVIDGVLRRLGDDLAATPQAARISGEEERYQALIEASASGIDLEEALERVRERPGAGAGTGEDAAAFDEGNDED